MSQFDAMRDLDAYLVGGMLAQDLADQARYYTPAKVMILRAIANHDPSSPIPPPAEPPAQACEVMVDRAVADYGDDPGSVSVLRTRIHFLRVQVEPEPGAWVEVDAETFELVQRASADESLSVWWVQHAV